MSKVTACYVLVEKLIMSTEDPHACSEADKRTEITRYCRLVRSVIWLCGVCPRDWGEGNGNE